MQENRTNLYNASATLITTVRMATITNLQVVQQTAIALSLALLNIQNTVQQVSPQDPLASCYTVREPVVVKPNDFSYKPNLQIFGGVITHLRDQVVKDAADTAECEYLIYFTYLLGHAC